MVLDVPGWNSLLSLGVDALVICGWPCPFQDFFERGTVACLSVEYVANNDDLQARLEDLRAVVNPCAVAPQFNHSTVFPNQRRRGSAVGGVEL